MELRVLFDVVGIGIVGVPLMLEEGEDIPRHREMESRAIEILTSIKENDCDFREHILIKEKEN